MVVASLLRLSGHGEHDDASYISAEMKASPVGRDCLKVAEGHLLSSGWADAGLLAEWRQEAVRQIEETVAMVQREPAPNPDEEDWSALASRHLIEGYME
jgi:pyruvate dehydrogenase E1 component alpha subunit/2-oxoisovalerate dehydrogenase E1 component alpha subunit